MHLLNGVCLYDLLTTSFQVISPSSEHLFQALNEQQLHAWVKAMQEATEEALKNSELGQRPPPRDFTRSYSIDKIDGSEVAASDVLEQVLSIPGNRQCADCSSTTGEECSCVCVSESIASAL